MFKPFKGICIQCKSYRWIVVKKGYCAYCNHAQKEARKKTYLTATRPEKVAHSALKSPPQKKKSSYNGKKALFQYIWANRPHFSEVSGLPLNYPFSPAMYFVFSHVVTRGAYKGLALYPANIVLMTLEEHRIWEFYRWQVQDLPRWEWIFLLHDLLIQEHHEQKSPGYSPRLLRSTFMGF